MGYADVVMLLRDADDEVEVVMERINADGDVLELRVTLGYGSPKTAHTGRVRLPRRHFDLLAEWIGEYANNLRNVQWAEENAPNEPTDDWLRASALLSRLKAEGSLDEAEAVAFLRSIVGADDE